MVGEKQRTRNHGPSRQDIDRLWQNQNHLRTMSRKLPRQLSSAPLRIRNGRRPLNCSTSGFRRRSRLARKRRSARQPGPRFMTGICLVDETCCDEVVCRSPDCRSVLSLLLSHDQLHTRPTHRFLRCLRPQFPAIAPFVELVQASQAHMVSFHQGRPPLRNMVYTVHPDQTTLG